MFSQGVSSFTFKSNLPLSRMISSATVVLSLVIRKSILPKQPVWLFLVWLLSGYPFLPRVYYTFSDNNQNILYSITVSFSSSIFPDITFTQRKTIGANISNIHEPTGGAQRSFLCISFNSHYCNPRAHAGRDLLLFHLLKKIQKHGHRTDAPDNYYSRCENEFKTPPFILFNRSANLLCH